MSSLEEGELPRVEVKKFMSTQSCRSGDIINELFELITIVGKGASGTVWSAWTIRPDSLDRRQVAVKICTNTVAHAKDNIQQMARKIATINAKEKQDCFVSDLFAGTLRDILLGEDLIPSQQVREIAWQIFAGLDFLHELDVVHSDIKPENIALTNVEMLAVQELDKTGKFVTKFILKNPRIKIIDFDEARASHHKWWNPVSTVQYQAPEIICANPFRIDTGWTEAVDVFAGACVVDELQTGRPFLPPTDNISLVLAYLEQSIGRISRGFAHEVHLVHPSTTSKIDPWRFLLPATIPDGKERSYKQVSKAHPLWMVIQRADLVDLLRKTLYADPIGCLTAAGALRHGYLS
ncbi:kinase-like domain-containing protein [Crepidotus variabilis]|uniref:Kinase-like domain-containing protein n=1 Tax=Crepidotus variabilis TaxID=179855 RepID=A0A9P6E3M3_9AGAR|nr:kinase-like domain-containing protein [Crepidotus variabilis]